MTLLAKSFVVVVAFVFRLLLFFGLFVCFWGGVGGGWEGGGGVAQKIYSILQLRRHSCETVNIYWTR